MAGFLFAHFFFLGYTYLDMAFIDWSTPLLPISLEDGLAVMQEEVQYEGSPKCVATFNPDPLDPDVGSFYWTSYASLSYERIFMCFDCEFSFL